MSPSLCTAGSPAQLYMIGGAKKRSWLMQLVNHFSRQNETQVGPYAIPNHCFSLSLQRHITHRLIGQIHRLHPEEILSCKLEHVQWEIMFLRCGRLMFTVHLYLKNLSVDVFLYLVWLNSMIDFQWDCLWLLEWKADARREISVGEQNWEVI